jgi:DNA-binding Lrp family transcriptional regulator
MTKQKTTILAELQKGLLVGPRPFCALAEKADCTEREAFAIVQSFMHDGTIRKFGGFINHNAAGFKANGMVVWDVPENLLEEIGKQLSQYKNISHCYARPRSDQWPYRLYTMIHGRSRQEVENAAKEISQKEGIMNYKILFSVKEYKKVNRWLGGD